MHRDTLHIAGACFLGAFVGGLVALDLSARFQNIPHLWVAGALLGGCIAYLTIQFRLLCNGVARSYHKSIASRPNYAFWNPGREYWKTWWVTFATQMLLAATVMIPAIWLAYSSGKSEQPSVSAGAFLFFGTEWVCLTILFTFLTVGRQKQLSQEKWHVTLQKLREHDYKMLRRYNPLALSILLLTGLWWVMARTPWALVAILSEIWTRVTRVAGALKRFIVDAFIFVHSERRTLCFVNAALGSAIGYYGGNAILGGVAGAILGVIMFEVVSVRLLKIAPTQK
jgi:hypothetical protein